MTGDEVAFVRLQAFLEAPSKHAAVRSKLVAVVVARMEPQKCGDLGAPEMPTLVALPNCFPIRSDQARFREDGGNTRAYEKNGQSRS